jgi:hypothetical protein
MPAILLLPSVEETRLMLLLRAHHRERPLRPGEHMFLRFISPLPHIKAVAYAFSEHFYSFLEHETKDIDYAALRDRTGVGMARGLAAETVIAIYKTARLGFAGAIVP